MSIRHREIILMAIFIALAVAIGQDPIPNVELVSATIFLSGLLLGTKRGVAVGAIATFLFSFFNAYGPASPPLLMAQMLGMMLVGFTGGCFQNFFGTRALSIWFLGATGFALTFVYDLLTTLSSTVVVETGWPGFVTALATGFYFFLLHQVSNAVIFASLLPILWRRLRQLAILQTPLTKGKPIPPSGLRPSLTIPAERKL